MFPGGKSLLCAPLHVVYCFGLLLRERVHFKAESKEKLHSYSETREKRKVFFYVIVLLFFPLSPFTTKKKKAMMPKNKHF